VLLVALACLLLNALDCYGAGLTNAPARKCCASGHCSPRNHDSCCKNTPSGANQALEFHPKISVQKPILNIVALNVVPADMRLSLRFDGFVAGMDGDPPPRSLPDNLLPLRI